MTAPEIRNSRVKEAIDVLLKIFDEDNLEKVAHAVFRGSDNIPSDKWSFFNRIIMFMHDTEDARGFKQWHEAGRHVMKGSKAFYILGPVFKKIKEEKPTASGETERNEKEILAGFRAIPVFRSEDTEGAPLITEDYKVNIPCEFNGIIQELNLKVVPVRFSGTYGLYNLLNKNIKLASPDIQVFLHELSHAVDDRLNSLKAGQKNDQEVTAEFSAAVIGYLMGYKIPLGNVKEYIESYSFKELLNSLSRIEKVVTFVIERTRMNSPVVNIPRQAAACIG
ncbi:MAG TPA: ArdC-like ssDNA-binding domain-containing protein [Candidatus Methylomirabilis sp.]|nr:ArdC-like ssDNA-binding domain-containing protein [Candidatus Methylomirabilis sp.]